MSSSNEMSQEETKRRLKDIAQAINERIPEGFVFFVLISPSGEGDYRANYVSNMRREDAINVMKEWLIRCSAGEDWMKHLE